MPRFHAAVLAALALVGVAGEASARCKIGVLAELPVVWHGNTPLLRGEINGKPMLALVDTGASQSLVWKGATSRFGLTARPLRGVKFIGVGGEQEAQSTMIDELALGGSRRKNVRMLVVGGSESVLSHEDVAMLIGQDILSSSDIEFDLANNMVRLIRADGCGDRSLVHWADAWSEARLKRTSNRSSRPDLAVDVRLNGKVVGAVMDTGASTSVVDTAAAARAGVSTNSKGVVDAESASGIGSRTIRSWVGVFDSFQIGDEVIQNAKLRMAGLFRTSRRAATGSRIGQSAMDETEMLLGADFFRAHRVLVSYSQNKIYFTHNGGPVFQTQGPLMAEDLEQGED